MGDETFAAIRDGGLTAAIITVPWAIVATAITAIVKGWLIPRKSHEEIVNGYKERATAAEIREQWWRDQAYSGTTMAGRALDITADLATRRAIVDSARGENRGNGDD